MKKIIALAALAALVLGTPACNKQDTPRKPNPGQKPTPKPDPKAMVLEGAYSVSMPTADIQEMSFTFTKTGMVTYKMIPKAKPADATESLADKQDKGMAQAETIMGKYTISGTMVTFTEMKDDKGKALSKEKMMEFARVSYDKAKDELTQQISDKMKVVYKKMMPKK